MGKEPTNRKEGKFVTQGEYRKMRNRGVLVVGRTGKKNIAPKTLQDFADMIYASKKETNNSYYVFGKIPETIQRAKARLGISALASRVIITDKVVNKYRHGNHPKEEKDAVINHKRFVMAEKAVKHPKHAYYDTSIGQLVFIGTTKYDDGRVVKVVIEPNKRMHKQHFDVVRYIGIVDATKLGNPQYHKIK